MNIQWYPGHMTKTRRMIAEQIKNVDAVCEILDARIPVSSRNPDVDELTAGKPRLVVLNRVDQADPEATKKWAAYFRSKGYPLLAESYAEAADVNVGDCFSIAKLLSKSYLGNQFDEIHVAYTNFVSVLSQTPAVRQLLPLIPEEREQTEGSRCVTLYEPDPEEVFASIVPEYLGGIVYGALCESRCAEQAARRTAMDSATSNAEDMIADLSLKYNRARQAAITQEITEIVAGAEA